MKSLFELFEGKWDHNRGDLGGHKITLDTLHYYLPLFGFLSSFLSYGIAIIVMTIIVRLLMSPVTYKSYVSQIKMKVLRPDVDAITAKYKDDAVKRQQETMSLYSRAGANPMSGCVPALIQLPVFYALFSFFPVHLS